MSNLKSIFYFKPLQITFSIMDFMDIMDRIDKEDESI